MDMTCLKTASRYTALYILRFAVVAVLLMVLAWYLLCRFVEALPSGVAGGSMEILSIVVGYIPVIIPVFILAFVVGYNVPRTNMRLVWRIVLNAYLIVVTLFITGDVTYTLHDVLLDQSTGAMASDLTMTVDATVTGLLLLIIPVCSIIDAFRERFSPVPQGDADELVPRSQ